MNITKSSHINVNPDVGPLIFLKSVFTLVAVFRYATVPAIQFLDRVSMTCGPLFRCTSTSLPLFFHYAGVFTTLSSEPIT